MKKNFIKVSVFCALMAATSAGVVSCSDYDDDIKNQQEQIDALKKQLDASKSEITTALQTAIEGLEAEIAQVAGEANANSEAVNNLKQAAEALQNAIDQKAGKDEIEGLSNAVQEQIDKVNAELAAAMEGVKEELNGKITDLTSKQEELSKKLEELMGAGGDTESIKAQLDQVAADLAEAMNQLKTIQEAKYGEQIAGLAADVAELKGLEEKVNGYTDEEIKKLDVALTAKITAAVDDVMTKVEDKYRPELDALSQKFADYATKNDMDIVVAFLGGLENLKGQTLEGLLNGKANAEDLTNLSNKVDGLIEEAMKEGGVITTAIKEEADAVRAEFDKIMGLMIQSLMYLPEYDANLQAKNLEFNTLELKSSDNGKFGVVAENVDGVVKFRVSPASAVAAFKEGKYTVTFEGQKLSRSGLINYLDAEYLENAELEEQGIVSFKVARSKDFVNEGAYALCAHVVPATGENTEENTTKEDYTDITSNFFVAEHSNIKIDNISVEINPLSEGAVPDEKQTFVWDGSKGESYDLSKGRKLVGKLNGVTQCDSLTGKFPSEIFNITYALKYANEDENRKPFAIDAQTGVVTLAKKESGMLGVTATPEAKLSVNVGGVKYNSTTTYTNRQFEVIKAILICNYEDLVVNWPDVATDGERYVLNAVTLANAFKMGTADLQNMLKKTEMTSNAEVVLADKEGNDLGNTVDLTSDKKSVVINIVQHSKHVGGELVINFKDKNAGSTTTASEYQIKINISAVQYPGKDELGWKRVEAVWGTKDNVILTPTISTEEVEKADKKKVKVVSAVDLFADIRSFYQNFTDVEKKAKDKYHAYVQFETPFVEGVFGADYITADPVKNNPIIVVETDNYKGGTIKGTASVKFNDDTPWHTESFVVELLQLAGTITAPSLDTQIVFEKKSDVRTINGFTWKDYNGRVMLKDGIVQTFEQGKLEDAEFKYDPLGNGADIRGLYSMNRPTYKLSETGEEAILKVDENGQVSFTDKGLGLAIQNDHVVTLYVTVQKPKWGPITFDGAQPKPVYDDNKNITAYTFEYKVVVPKTVANN